MTDSPSSASVQSTSGGVSLAADQVSIGGDVVGRDKIVAYHGYTAEEVSTLLAQIGRTFQPKPFDGRCPYLGLAHFDEDNADLFFGRETLVRELIDHVRGSRSVFITGPSGSGKSSIARAGVLSALKNDALPDSARWLYAALTPSRDPLEALAAAVTRLTKSPEVGDYLRAHRAEPDALHKCIEVAMSDRPDQRAVLLIDQFEETFTQVGRESERSAFLNLLTYAATLERGRVTLIFAMRSDFVSNCAAYPPLNALLNQNFLQVGAMTSAELVSAIAQPALRVGLQIEPELVAQIITDMQGEPGVLPLVQFALRDLFEARQAAGGVIALTRLDYLERGGIHKALERHADLAFGQLTTDEQSLARTVFSGLIQIGHGTQDVRRTARFDELVPAQSDRSAVETVVGKLASARLITTDQQADRDIVSIAHEKLIEAWPWLRKLINENRETIALQNQIAEDAQEWEQYGCDASYLYVGGRLANAQERLVAKRLVLSGLAQSFIMAGVEAEQADRAQAEARRQKELDDARKLAESEKQRAEEQSQSAARLRRSAAYLIGALGVALLLGIAAGVFGIQSNENAAAANRSASTAEAAGHLAATNASQAEAESTRAAQERMGALAAEFTAQVERGRAQTTTSRLLAKEALERLSSGQLDVALLISLEAYQTRPTFEALNSLRAGLEAGAQLDRLLRAEPSFKDHMSNNIVFDRERRLLMARLGDNIDVLAWNLVSGDGQVLQKNFYNRTGGSSSVVFSPDGQRFVVDSRHWPGSLTFYDTATGELLGDSAIMSVELEFAGRMAFVPPDGALLAASLVSDTLTFWDTTTHAVSRRFDGLGLRSDPAFAFSADGTRLALAGPGRTVVLRDTTTGEIIETTPPFPGLLVRSLALSPDGRWLAIGGFSGSLILWDVPGRRLVGQPALETDDTVIQMAFSTDSQSLAFEVQRSAIYQWNVTHEQPIRLLTSPSLVTEGPLAYSPDDRKLAAALSPEVVALFDTRPVQAVRRDLAQLNTALEALTFTANNHTLVALDSTGALLAWDVSSGQATSPPGAEADRLRADRVALSAPCLQPTRTGCAQFELTLPVTLSSQTLIDGPGDVSAWALSPDRQTLAIGTTRNFNAPAGLSLWNLAQHESRHVSGIVSDTVTALAFSPDGQRLAISSEDAAVIVIDLTANESAPDRITRGDQKQIARAVTFCDDGQWLITAGTAELIVWNAATLQAKVQLPFEAGGPPPKLACSPDGKWVAASTESGVTIWNIDFETWQARACQMINRNFTAEEWEQFFSGVPYKQTCAPLSPPAQ